MAIVSPTMDGFTNIKKIREYCDYLERHLNNVQKAWVTLQKVLSDDRVIYDDFYFHMINHLISEHDLSKFSKEEFIQYQEVFFPVGYKGCLGDAWDNHKRLNPHHWENWTKRNEKFPDENVCHCVCMICDWMAMSMELGGTAEEYYQTVKDDIALPEWADKFLMETFQKLKERDDG